MRAKLEELTGRHQHQSFICYRLQVPSFDFVWHYHPEFEITLIEEGRGKRLVGDSYEYFEPGDLVLLGANLPHTWVSEHEKKSGCAAVVIQFSAAFIEPLLHYPELKNIAAVLNAAANGLKLSGAKAGAAAKLIREMPLQKELTAFTTLLHVLQIFATNKTIPLSSAIFKPLKDDDQQHRINKVFKYVQRKFTGSITLQQAAAMVHLSESAFCKYFKRVSGKTFSDYVNDIRIANACQLLIETDHPVALVSAHSGFESISYFNRIFRRKKQVSPMEYRKSKG